MKLLLIACLVISTWGNKLQPEYNEDSSEAYDAQMKLILGPKQYAMYKEDRYWANVRARARKETTPQTHQLKKLNTDHQKQPEKDDTGGLLEDAVFGIIAFFILWLLYWLLSDRPRQKRLRLEREQSELANPAEIDIEEETKADTEEETEEDIENERKFQELVERQARLNDALYEQRMAEQRMAESLESSGSAAEENQELSKLIETTSYPETAESDVNDWTAEQQEKEDECDKQEEANLEVQENYTRQQLAARAALERRNKAVKKEKAEMKKLRMKKL